MAKTERNKSEAKSTSPNEIKRILEVLEHIESNLQISSR